MGRGGHGGDAAGAAARAGPEPQAAAMGDKLCIRPSSVFITFVRVKEYVFFPNRGENSPKPKLYKLVVEKDDVVYRLRVNH